MIMCLSFLPLKSYTCTCTEISIIKKFTSLQNVERSWSSTASSNFFENRKYFSLGISWAFQCNVNPSLKFQHNLQTLRTYSVFSKGRPGDRRSSSNIFLENMTSRHPPIYWHVFANWLAEPTCWRCPANLLGVRSMTTLHHILLIFAAIKI